MLTASNKMQTVLQTVGLNKGLRAALFVDKSPSFNYRLRTQQFVIELRDGCNHGAPQSVQLQVENVSVCDSSE